MATEWAATTPSMAKKAKKHPRKVSDAPDKEETWHSEEGLQ